MKALTLSLFLMALSSSAFGRIEETLAQCDKRYGDRVMGGKGESDWAVYEKNGICVIASFHKGVCDEINFSSDASLLGIEVMELLKANSGGSEWEKAGSESVDGILQQLYKRKDGKAFARWNHGADGLTIETAEVKQRRDAAIEKAATQTEAETDKSATEGF